MIRIVVFFVIIFLGGISESTAEKTFIITTETFAPYIGKQFKNYGWTMEVANAALKPQGYKVILKLRPWKRALMESQKGMHDGLYLSYYVKEREEWYIYSDPIGEVRTGFYKIKDRNISYKTLQDLIPYKIGLTRGAAVCPKFDKADFLRKEFTTADTQSLKKLLMGRIDLYAGSELVAKYFINTDISPMDRNKFEFMEPPLSIQKLHMAVSKKAPDYMQKLKDFNLGGIFSQGSEYAVKFSTGASTSRKIKIRPTFLSKDFKIRSDFHRFFLKGYRIKTIV